MFNLRKWVFTPKKCVKTLLMQILYILEYNKIIWYTFDNKIVQDCLQCSCTCTSSDWSSASRMRSVSSRACWLLAWAFASSAASSALKVSLFYMFSWSDIRSGHSSSCQQKPIGIGWQKFGIPITGPYRTS